MINHHENDLYRSSAIAFEGFARETCSYEFKKMTLKTGKSQRVRRDDSDCRRDIVLSISPLGRNTEEAVMPGAEGAGTAARWMERR